VPRAAALLGDGNELDKNDELEKRGAIEGKAVSRRMGISRTDGPADPLTIALDQPHEVVTTQGSQQLSLAQALLQVLLPYPRTYPQVPGIVQLCTRIQAELDAGRPHLPGPSDVQFVNPPAKSKGGPWQRASGGGGKSKADTSRTLRR